MRLVAFRKHLFITQNERSIRFMKKTWKRLCTGFLALATVVTALPTTPVHAESKQSLYVI